MQDTATRVAVDKRCVVTGPTVVKRARGGNSTGLEVAHIYPLMAVGVVNTDLCHRIHLSHLLHIGRLDRTETARTCSDTSIHSPGCHNAILLRADIHSLFDDYQWSIWVCQF